MTRKEVMVFTHAEIAALADYAYTASTSRASTFRIVLDRGVKYIEHMNGKRYRITPEYAARVEGV